MINIQKKIENNGCSIHFRHTEETSALISFIRQKAHKLNKLFKPVIACHVLVEKSQKRNEPGGVYRLRIEIAVRRRKELVVKKETNVSSSNPSLRPLVSDAFEAAEQELQKRKPRLRH